MKIGKIIISTLAALVMTASTAVGNINSFIPENILPETNISAEAASIESALAEKQTSKKNKNLLLHDKNPEATVGGYGCLFMSSYFLSVETGAISPDTTPAEFLKMMKKANAFDIEGYLTSWEAITKVCPTIKCGDTVSLSGDKSKAISKIKKYLNQNYKCIVYVTIKNSPHYVYAYLDSKGNMKIADSSFNYGSLSSSGYTRINSVTLYKVQKKVTTDTLVNGATYIIYSADNDSVCIGATGKGNMSNVKCVKANKANKLNQWKAIGSGNSWKFVNVASGRVMDICVNSISSVKNGTNIHIHSNQTKRALSATQTFKPVITKTGGSVYYRFAVSGNTSFVLDCAGVSVSTSSNVRLYRATAKTNMTQNFILRKIS